MLTSKQYLYLTSFIFFVVGLAHVIRLIFELGIIIAGFVIPIWVSIIGFLIAWYLSYCAFTLARKKK